MIGNKFSLRNLDTKTYAVAAAAAVVLGLCMIIWRDESSRIICYVIGAFMLLYGLVDCVRYFFADDEGAAFRGGLVDGALAIGIGLFCLIRPAQVSGTFDVIIGIVTLVDGLIKLQFGINLMRAGDLVGRAVLAAAAGAIIVGVLMIVLEHITVLALGILFLCNGLADIFTVIALHRFEKAHPVMRRKPETTESVKTNA